jgi:hypothetical protein
MRSLGSGAGSGLNQRPVAYRIERRYLGAATDRTRRGGSTAQDRTRAVRRQERGSLRDLIVAA